MNSKIALFTCALLFGLSVGAAEGNTEKKDNNTRTTAATKSSKKAKKSTKKDIDDEITNARLRTTSGSKSKFSSSLSLSYSGGSLKKPFGKARPDLYGSTNPDSLALAGGSLSFRYRFNKNLSSTFGWGFSALTPLHGNPKLKSRSQFELSNPSFGLSSSYKVGRWQNATSVSLGIGVSDKSKETASAFGLNFSQNTLTTIGKWTLGLYTGLSFSTYAGEATKCEFRNTIGSNKNCSPKNGSPVDPNPRVTKGSKIGALHTWSIGLAPYAEYTLNKRYSLRTVFGWFNFQNTLDKKSPWSLSETPKYQSLGLGISINRDVYLYPNVQFNPENIDIDKTNVGVSLILNMF